VTWVVLRVRWSVRPWLQTLEVKVGDEVGWDGPAEAEDRGRDDDGGGRLNGIDDRTHRQREDELGQKYHAGKIFFRLLNIISKKLFFFLIKNFRVFFQISRFAQNCRSFLYCNYSSFKPLSEVCKNEKCWWRKMNRKLVLLQFIIRSI